MHIPPKKTLRASHKPQFAKCFHTNTLVIAQNYPPSPIWGWGCSGDCDSWVFDCRPLTSRHNRRVNSRNPKTESSELNDLKELRLVYPWRQAGAILIGRTIGRPTQWKADLHAFALSLLPVVVAVHALLAMPGNIGATFIAIMVLYAIMVVMVVFFKGLSRKVVDNKKALNRLGYGLLALVFFAFHPAVPKILGSDPVDEAVVTLIGAAIVAFISQKFLALDLDYLVEAKKSPPLFGDREKTVWKIAAAVYGVLVVVTLPRLLPENIPMTIIVGGGLAVLLYYLFK